MIASNQLTVVLFNSGGLEITERDDDKEPVIAKSREVLRRHRAGLADDPDHLTRVTVETEQGDGSLTPQPVYLAGSLGNQDVSGGMLSFLVPSGQEPDRLGVLFHLAFTNEDQEELLAVAREHYVRELAPAFHQSDAEVPHFPAPTTPLMVTMVTPEVLYYESALSPLCILAEALVWAWLSESLH